MTWFRRATQRDDAPPPPPAPEDDDSPAALLQRQWELVQFINRNAGRLPPQEVGQVVQPPVDQVVIVVAPGVA